MLYTAGRVWIESLRIDTVNHLGPFRLNVWTSIIVFVLGLVLFVVASRRARRAVDTDETVDHDTVVDDDTGVDTRKE
jgi:prolipoprotein diacylglyceryltransferase